MSKNHNWRIKREYYNLINRGIKTLEVRVGYPDIKKVHQGDTITFKDYSNTQFEVIRVTRYVDFPEMLDTEDSSKAIPNVSKYKALDMYQAIYPEDKEALGVYVFELAKVNRNVKVVALSSRLNQHDYFAKMVQQAYNITDHICKDYPKHFEWYWTKEVPRVFNGTGEIIVCTVGSKLAGVAFLKKDDTERKICTIYVQGTFRGKHIASKLLEKSFEYLGTTTPLISVADYKQDMFKHIIAKYKWELTQTLDKGYYNNKYSELVYNGTIH